MGIAYPIPLQGAAMQAVDSADRPLCAKVAAYAAYLRGDPLRGDLWGKPRQEAEAAILGSIDLPGYVVADWAKTINGEKIGMAPRTVGSLTLSQYQVDAVKAMGLNGGGLGLGCGLGKTIVALATVAMWQRYYNWPRNKARLLIICPLNAYGTWKKALADATEVTGLFGDVMVESMDSAHKLLGLPFSEGAVIFDEAHLLGEERARRTDAAHTLRARHTCGLCLTGTLLHAGPHKALSVLDLCVPGGSLFATRWKAGEYFKCLAKKKIGNRTVTELVKPSGENRTNFHAYVSRLVYMRTARSPEVRHAINLPDQDLVDQEFAQPWKPLHHAAAEAAVNAMNATGVLPQAAAIAHLLCREGAEEKADFVLANLDDEPLVIFAGYIETLDLMHAKLEDAGIPFVRVDGSVTGKARAQAEADFNDGKVQVFLGQMVAAGISMNLQRASLSVALDHPWRPDAYSQALARTCRRGQTKPCLHIDMVANQLQAKVVDRLRRGEEFNAEAAEWQVLRLAAKTGA